MSDAVSFDDVLSYQTAIALENRAGMLFHNQFSGDLTKALRISLAALPDNECLELVDLSWNLFGIMVSAVHG